MKKATVTIPYDEEKLAALRIYMQRKDTDLDRELLAQLEAEGVRVLTPSDDFRNSVREEMEETVWQEWLADAGDAGQTVLDQVNSLL